RALMGLGELKQARTELSQATQQFPDLPEARLQMAALDLRERNFRSAEEGFRKLHTQYNDPRAFLGLIDSYVGQGQTAAAIRMLRDELEKDPNRSDYRMVLATIAMNSNDLQTAIAEYKIIIDKDPSAAQAWLRLSEAHRRAGDISSA